MVLVHDILTFNMETDLLLIPLPLFEYEMSPYHMVFIDHVINGNFINEG